MFTLRLAFFYCFLFYASFPHWMELGQLLPSNKGVLTPGPFLRRPSLRRRRRHVHGIHGGFTIVGHFFVVFLLTKKLYYFFASLIRIGEGDPRAKPARQPIVQVRNRRGRPLR